MNDDEIIILEEQDEVIDFRYSITSYGADYPVDSIIKRIDDGSIYVPKFQRKFVWSIAQASKFIESLILGLPVPGIFLSKESDTGKLLIIDGQQRLLSLFSFYEKVFKDSVFKLRGVQEDLEGKTIDELNPQDKLRLDDSIIHATVIRQDEPSNDDSSIYLIFERLNTGGKPLTSQEIRACIYHGEFNEFLSKLIENPSWRPIFGKPNERMKEQELILRFLALLFELDNYTKPLKSFLNTYMARNRDISEEKQNEFLKVFVRTIDFINKALGEKAFRSGKAFNAAIFDSIMIGTAKRLEHGNILNLDMYLNAYDQLMNNDEYVKNTRAGTSDEKIVKDRVQKAISVFEKIE